MTERLSDEQVAQAIEAAEVLGHAHEAAMLREVQATRLLLNGGPCPTCGGRGDRVVVTDQGLANAVCPNPDCVDGRVPGIIDRLASAEARLIGAMHHADIDMALREVQRCLAQLREVQ